VPNPVLRVLLAIIALIAALLMVGAGAGVAAADPDDPGPTSEPDPGGETTAPTEPEPTTGLPPATPPSIFDIPQTIANQLRDMLGRPLSIFGNGRVPGTHTVPGATQRRRDKPAKKDEPKPDLAPPDSIARAPARRNTSTVEVTLPFAAPIVVRVPSVPVPGYETVRWSLDLTDPYAAFTSVGQTLNTVNSLLSDAYAPYDPFKPPAPQPKPQPTFRILEEEPSVVDADGADGATPLASGSSDLPVLQAPVAIPRVRVVAPRPISGSAPAVARAPSAGSTGAPLPEPRGPVAQPGSMPAETLPPSGSTAAMGTPAPREGYPRYLRSARVNQMAAVALPGLAGLIAITASGGVIGYRQANSGRYPRTEAARFLQ
jgi:hypothetical protein